MVKKNLLIITPFNPYPLTSGGHQAIFNGIAILKDIANVYVLIDCTESQYKRGEHKRLTQVLPWVNCIPYILPESRHTLKWYCRVLWNKISTTLNINLKKGNESVKDTTSSSFLFVANEYSEEKKHFILEIISKYNIDIVQVDMIDGAAIVDVLPQSIKTILVHHEIRFVRNELFMAQMSNITDDDKKRFFVCKQREIELLNRFNNIVTLSSIDTEKLRAAGVTTPITTSMAVVRDVEFPIEHYPVRKVLSYVGPEMHYPNYDGIMWFLKNCWNKLLAIDSEYKLQIIGLWNESTAQKIAEQYQGVQCVGFVENLVQSIAGTTMIVPLNIGSGIRMKILEAAQIGIPVVATPVGAEGLPLENGIHAFITADADEFIEDIIALQEESLRRKFVENTRNAIKNQYSFEALKRNRITLYD